MRFLLRQRLCKLPSASNFAPPSLCDGILPSPLQGGRTQNPGPAQRARARLPRAGLARPLWGISEAQPGLNRPGSRGQGRGQGRGPVVRAGTACGRAHGRAHSRARGLPAGCAAGRPRELTRPRVSAGIPDPALNMPVIFISLRQAAKAIPPVAQAAATQCFPLVGRGNGGRPDFLITWC